MQELDDNTLLREYVERNSEEAFAALVTRHVNKVYSVALRHTHNSHQAEEITQAVFVILAKKSHALDKKVILSGWLYETSRLTAATFIRSEIRRAHREQEAHLQNSLNETASDPWPQIAPSLDLAIAGLSEADRQAIVLRYFDGKSVKEVGAALGTGEGATKMRLNRAVEKLRGFFTRRGIVLPSTILISALSANSVQAAPFGLATSVTVAALNGTAVTTATSTLIKATLKVMAWTKFKAAAVVGIITILLAGTTTVVIQTVNAQTNAEKASTKPALTAFAGFATPEAALKSFVWSESTGNLDKLLAACTPEQAARFKKKIEGKPLDELKRLMVEEAKNRSNYQITEKETISENEVRLHLLVQPFPGHPNVGQDVQVMQKIGVEWKYAGKYGVDIKEQ